MTTRRDILQGLTLLAGSSAVLHPSWAQTPTEKEVPRHPDWTTYQSGDFLWPAKPRALIVRSLARPDAPPVAADVLAEWTRERDAAVAALRASTSPDVRRQADALGKMTYQQFRAQYFEGIDPNASERTRSLGTSVGRIAVGHIAIVEIDADGAPWVLEATPTKTARQYDIAYTRFAKGVIRTSYDDWIEEHDEYNVWHGRLRGKPADDRAQIATIARGFVDRDYWFWSLNLADEKSFYCSKLAWLSSTRALGTPLDGEPATDRSFWVTPKTIMGLKMIEMLHVPAEYGAGR
jgi:hypothetical protein